MKKASLFILIAFIGQPVFGQTKEICITFDDLPVISYDFQNIEFQRTLVDKLIKTFDAYQIPAIGFVNENKLYNKEKLDEAKVSLLKTWLAAGYEVGNHTYSHKDYHKVSFEKFTKDILDGEKVCKPLVEEFGKEYTYFRHPFLHVGLDKAKHDSLRAFLSKHNYTEAPVSIDNDDYIFAYAYNKAMLKKDEKLMQQIGNEYVDYMEKKLLYFESQSGKLLERNVKHILLLHANAINADYLGELANRFREHGYTYISMEQALSDDAYQKEITTYNDWGISWIDRWALSAGKKSEFFKDDPQTPDYIRAFLNE